MRDPSRTPTCRREAPSRLGTGLPSPGELFSTGIVIPIVAVLLDQAKNEEARVEARRFSARVYLPIRPATLASQICAPMNQRVSSSKGASCDGHPYSTSGSGKVTALRPRHRKVRGTIPTDSSNSTPENPPTTQALSSRTAITTPPSSTQARCKVDASRIRQTGSKCGHFQRSCACGATCSPGQQWRSDGLSPTNT
jgi:hypothetical protein